MNAIRSGHALVQRHLVIIRSRCAFHDNNGDGIGISADCKRASSTTCSSLALPAIWLMPFFSTIRDDGYDIADYTPFIRATRHAPRILKIFWVPAHDQFESSVNLS